MVPFASPTKNPSTPLRKQKINSSKRIIQMIKSYIKTIPGSRIAYVKICNPETLEYVSNVKSPVLIAVAVWVGKTRLIDNIIVN